MSQLSTIVVGAGFSGLAAGIGLKRKGIEDFVILEQGAGVGGTWRDNTYPGAPCDIPSHLYSYSFEPNPKWQRAYGGQPEILAYLEHCATKYGLRPHLRFGARVVRCDYDEPSATWSVTTAQGTTYVARSLILGNGALHIPKYPAIAGRDSFGGAQFHSARWNHRVDLAGKRVAVIGTGASTIQFVPEIAKQAAQLHVFQRTPPWIVPKRDRAIGKREQRLLERLPAAHWLRRSGLYWLMESRVLGFAFAPKLNEVLEKIVLKYLEASVPDPELRRKLTPDYRMGCKRVLISNDYYPALQRDNVELVTDGIAGIERAGIRTVDGQLREVDAIVYGTGFEVAEYLSSMKITGAGGVTLEQAWRGTIRNYLGINVAGFPNMFLLMGPNTGLGHNSMIFMIEAQARYALEAISALHRNGLASLDVKPEVETAFVAEMGRRLKNTVWTSGCNSWYQTTGDGEGQVLLWPGFTFDYWRRTRRIELANYQTRNLGSAISWSNAGVPGVPDRGMRQQLGR
jgi:cation diffusion facilitator CzcD-associated flavoprotein CzcO